jgi:aminocarboxymuconate-semialdehyde decarboxylase
MIKCQTGWTQRARPVIVYQPVPGIDLHTHLAPLLPSAIAGVEPTADGRLVVDGHRIGLPGLYEPERLVSGLHGNELDEAIVSIPPPFFRQHQDPEAAAGWAAAVNDGLLAVTAGHAELTPLAYLPLEHPAAARAEYERIRADTRFAGVVGSAGGASASLADPALHPLWDALHADARLLLLHPGTSPDRRLDEFYLSNLLGNPVETAVAAAQLVFGDVLARWTALRVLLVHCGGCVPGLVSRWQRGVETGRPGVAPLTEPPRVAVRRLYVDCLVHDHRAVDHAVVAHRDPAFVATVATANANAALGRR